MSAARVRRPGRISRRSHARQVLVATAFATIGCSSPEPASSARELRDIFPAETRVREFVLTPDGLRTYYVTPAGGLWLYDRDRGSEARLIDGDLRDLSLSPRGDAVAYARAGETRREQFVWVLPLDPATGLASGRERRLSGNAGDVPSISPDGRRVAFARDDSTGVGQSVVVVPLDGGAERVVAAALPSTVGSIRWTPDGSTLYFGVNPPLPFTCAESCISPGGDAAVPGTIRRVPAAGGPVTVVVTTRDPNPGLSPDGSLLAFRDTASTGGMVIADADGRSIEAIPLPTNQILQGWYAGSTLLSMASGPVRRLYLTTLPDADSRLLFEGNQANWTPAWSPDGTTVLIGGRGAHGCVFRVLDLDGSPRRTITLPEGECGFGGVWTADQSRIVYRRYVEGGPPGIATIDVATGRTTELRPPGPDDMGWVLDGDAVVVSAVSGEQATPRVSFWRLGLGGGSRLLRELPSDRRPAWVTPLDTSLALLEFQDPSEARLVRLDSSAEDRTLGPARDGYFQPSVSPDGEWVAFRLSSAGAEANLMNVVEVARLDGSVRYTTELPFIAQPQVALAFLQGTGLIVTERPVLGNDAGIYLVDVAADVVRKLFDYTPWGRLPEFAVAPDGKAMLALITQTLSPVVTATDLSGIR